MFTGLVEEVGRISRIQPGAKSCILTVDCQRVLEGTAVGDSIMTSGVCLTVTRMDGHSFTADVMSETLNRSALKSLKIGSAVNLERAMPADGRFGGHMVAGHIDDTGTITAIKQDDNAVWYTVAAAPAVLRYIVAKGSIAMDGISLTVARVDDKGFAVSVIPHTREVTALADKKAGDAVNLECDMVGKYIEKLMRPQAVPKTQGITEAFLMKNGF